MDPVFEPLPEDLASISDDELAVLVDAAVALAQRIHDGDPELIGTRTAAEIVAEMQTGVEIIEALRAEQAGRDEARDEAANSIEALAARAGLVVAAEDTEEPEAAEEPAAEDEEDPEAVEDPEAIAAAAEPNRHASRPYISRSRQAVPQPRDRPRASAVITASSDIPGFSAGSELPDRRSIAEAMMARRRSFSHAAGGIREDIGVATIRRAYDESEMLVPGDDDGNWAKIQAKVGPQALAASGGLCAPVTPYYDLLQISTDARPVRDSLPRFNATRGGIRFGAPPSISGITTGVGHMTAANDAIGGTTATKTCQHITCPAITEVDVDMIYHCLQFGNLGSRTWPEQVENFIELAMAAQASVAETFLLDGIDSHSTATTASATFGAVGSLLGQIITAASTYRSRHRMDPSTTLRLMMPSWTVDLLVSDLIRSAFHRFEPNRGGLLAFLGAQNVAPTFYLDTHTGAGQVAAAQAGGALNHFPATVVWYLFAEGSFLWLDSGTLDLGIVRDSVLNTTNDYSVFGETFENIAYVGIESIKVTSTVSDDGAVANGVTVSPPGQVH